MISIGFLIKTFLAEDLAHKLARGILMIFSLLFFANILMAMPDIIKYLTQAKILAAEKEVVSLTDVPPERIQTHPNVFYFIFDEYGGNENLQRYTGFDNIAFLRILNPSGL